jgi:hypothetical protein
MIWNNEGRLVNGLPKSRFKAIVSIQMWTKKHPTRFLMGTGQHIKVDAKGMGHDWDQTLNSTIKNWIDENDKLQIN